MKRDGKPVKPQKSNVDKTRFSACFSARFINILSTLKSKICKEMPVLCKEMPVYAGFQ